MRALFRKETALWQLPFSPKHALSTSELHLQSLSDWPRLSRPILKQVHPQHQENRHVTQSNPGCPRWPYVRGHPVFPILPRMETPPFATSVDSVAFGHTSIRGSFRAVNSVPVRQLLTASRME